MKVKDLLRHIEEYRKQYPDIDEWEVYTEQPELCSPTDGISYETFFEKCDSLPVVEYDEEAEQWTLRTMFGDKLYFSSKEEAEDMKNNFPKITKSYKKKLKDCYETIKEYEKAGWHFKYDSEGWVYRDTNNVDCNHTLFPKEKIFTINNNY